MLSKTAIENDIKRKAYKTFWRYLVAWVIVGGCLTVANANSSQSHLQATSETIILSGLLGGLFYGILIGLPTAFSMAILERWMLRGYKVRAFQIVWAIIMLVVLLASNNDLGWISYLLLVVFYGALIATIVFNNAMKKRYTDDLKKHKAPKPIILQEREEMKEVSSALKDDPTDESDDDFEDML